MSVHAERGISAPPEVVFNTATDPLRATWLPEPLRGNGPAPTTSGDDLSAEWHSPSGVDWSARLRVEPVDAGGARVRLELTGELNGQTGELDGPGGDAAGAGAGVTGGQEPPAGAAAGPERLAEIARNSLDDQAGQVVDNLTAG